MFNIADNRIFMNDENGKTIAEVTFPNLDDNTVIIDHTFVDDSLRGQGIAAKLMLEVVSYAKANNKKIKASCSTRRVPRRGRCRAAQRRGSYVPRWRPSSPRSPERQRPGGRPKPVRTGRSTRRRRG